MKSNLDKYYKGSEELEKNGVWFEISDKTAFLIKPFKGSNPKVKSAMAVQYKPYARQIEMGTLPEEKVTEINIRIFVSSCLVDWRGVEIDGVETKFDVDTAVKLFKELPDLFMALFDHSKNNQNYREDVGNS
jgi:hypothetical protein